MRKLILTGMAVAMLAVPAAASASVSVDNGVGHVDKGDVQTALGWNNPAFDKGASTLKFTATAEKFAVDYPMTCFDLTTGAQSSGGHRQIIYSGTTTVEATPIYNAGNGKQITGFNLTGKSTGFTFTGGKTVDTGCPEGSVLFMNEGLATQPGTITVTGGLKVNGIDLPNTPVAVAPVA